MKTDAEIENRLRSIVAEHGYFGLTINANDEELGWLWRRAMDSTYCATLPGEVEKAVRDEREACAKIADAVEEEDVPDRVFDESGGFGWCKASQRISRAIRARGNTVGEDGSPERSKA